MHLLADTKPGTFGSNKRVNLTDYGIKGKTVAVDQGPVLHLAPKRIAKLKLESGGWTKKITTTLKLVCSDGEMQSQSHWEPLVAYLTMINCCSSHLLILLR